MNASAAEMMDVKIRKAVKIFSAAGPKFTWLLGMQQFPCTGNMLDNRRIRAFARFAGEYGEEFLLDCLEKNEKNGIVYHYQGRLDGDYDVPDTEEGIFDMLLSGRKAK